MKMMHFNPVSTFTYYDVCQIWLLLNCARTESRLEDKFCTTKENENWKHSGLWSFVVAQLKRGLLG